MRQDAAVCKAVRVSGELTATWSSKEKMMDVESHASTCVAAAIVPCDCEDLFREKLRYLLKTFISRIVETQTVQTESVA